MKEHPDYKYRPRRKTKTLLKKDKYPGMNGPTGHHGGVGQSNGPMEGHHGGPHGGGGGGGGGGPGSRTSSGSSGSGSGSVGGGSVGGAVGGGNPNSGSGLNHHHPGHPPPGHPHHNLNPRDLYSHQAINGYMPNGYAIMSDPSAYSGEN